MFRFLFTCLSWLSLAVIGVAAYVLVVDPRIDVSISDSQVRAAVADRLPITRTVNMINVEIGRDLRLAFRENGTVFVSAPVVANPVGMREQARFVGRIELAGRPILENRRFYLRELHDLRVDGDVALPEELGQFSGLLGRRTLQAFMTPEALEAILPLVLAETVERVPIYEFGSSWTHRLAGDALKGISVSQDQIRAAVAPRAVLLWGIAFLSSFVFAGTMAYALTLQGQPGILVFMSFGLISA